MKRNITVNFLTFWYILSNPLIHSDTFWAVVVKGRRPWQMPTRSRQWLTSLRSVTFRLHSITFWTPSERTARTPALPCHSCTDLTQHNYRDQKSQGDFLSLHLTIQSHKDPMMMLLGVGSKTSSTPRAADLMNRFAHPLRSVTFWTTLSYNCGDVLHSYTFWTTLSYFPFDLLHSLTFLLRSYTFYKYKYKNIFFFLHSDTFWTNLSYLCSKKFLFLTFRYVLNKPFAILFWFLTFSYILITFVYILQYEIKNLYVFLTFSYVPIDSFTNLTK